MSRRPTARQLSASRDKETIKKAYLNALGISKHEHKQVASATGAALSSALGKHGKVLKGSVAGRAAEAAASSMQAADRPKAAVIRDILEVLKANRTGHTLQELGTAIRMDLGARADVVAAMTKHPRLFLDRSTHKYYFRAQFEVRNESELLQQLYQSKFGVPYNKLKDAYIGAEADIERLTEKRSIIKLYNAESKAYMLYFRDKYPAIELERKFRMLWRSVELPKSDLEIQEELRSSGLKTIDAVTEAKSMTEAKKRKRPRRRGNQRLANTHVTDVDLDLHADLDELRAQATAAKKAKLAGTG